MKKQRKVLVILISILSILIYGQEKGKKIEIERDKNVDVMIEKALKAIKANQKKSGAIGNSYEVANTSICGLALLAAGYQAGRGKYGGVVKKAIEYLLSRGRRNQNGYITEDTGQSQMHGHGFALTFLSYAYGDACTLKQEIDCDVYKKVIKRAVKLAEQAQSANGGWIYTPDGRGDENSVTVCVVMGLRAAKEAGFRVDPKVIKKGLNILKIAPILMVHLPIV